MGEVTFICKRTVISTKAVEPGKFSPLSVLDRIMEGNHVRIVLYYNLPTRRRPGELTKRLRETISEALSAYPPVIGRLVRTPEGHWTVKCNDAGVRMVEAKVNGTVQEWLQNVDREKELMLVHWEEIYHKPYFWSTFYVQITEFECGGLAIGLSCSHMLSDPTSATMLIKVWADTTLGGQTAPAPVFRPLPTPPQQAAAANTTTNPTSIDHYKSGTGGGGGGACTPPPTSTITLQFSQESVARCVAAAGPHATPFDALTALLWTRIRRIRGAGPELSLSICFDARSVLGLESGFFGSCMVFNKVAGAGLSEDVAGAATAIREAGMDGDGVMEVIEWLERESEVRLDGGNNDVVCVNLESVGVYGAVFEGDAAPLRAACYVEPVGGAGKVLIMPAVEPGGRVAAVTLPEDEAKKLLEDTWVELQGVVPVVVMGLPKK
ncbi:protein ECERIFERUM 26-like [Salvia splendens]|uniref:protein ECERIFERUM 26-like n=1 Tax=Salvia splendens TaxID=180675 RepID=UPI001C25E9F0|nr:protein ECERIFERUM 26-like [Salvia splendens]